VIGNMRSLLILGTRLLAEELTDLVSDIPCWEVAGYVENLDPARCATKIAGKPVYWVDDIGQFQSTHCAVCGISTVERWQFVDQVARWTIPFATLVHPLARISRTSTMGEGSILSPGTIIASNTRLGCHVFVNRGVLIGHHTEIEDYVSIQPGANIAGAVKIGARTYVGMGATVIDHVSIGRDCKIAAGSVVTRNLPDNSHVAGSPARTVRLNPLPDAC
jgi:sugar O-acyltransferase (sialic acid O-acetyltransferase NeuD family)